MQTIIDPHVVVAGSGPPLILAHGAGGSVSANFSGVIEALSAERTLIGVDYPGSGATPADPAALELPVLADALVDAAVGAGFETFPILGLSLGCAVAVTAAVRHPDRVTGLVLTVGFAVADPQLRLVVDTWTVLAAADPRALAGYLVSLSSPATLELLDDDSVASAIDSTLRDYPEGGVDQALLAAGVDIVKSLPSVGVPSLVVVGGQDRIVLPSSTRALARHLPNATLVEYAGAGHIFTPDEQVRWIGDIAAHLDTHSL